MNVTIPGYAVITLLTLVAIPMLINKSTEGRGEWIKKYLREAWFVVVVVYVLIIALLPDGSDFVMKSKPAFATAHPMLSYFIVGLTAAALACSYWFLLGKIAPAPKDNLSNALGFNSFIAGIHASGTNVSGILWRAPYSELRFNIINPTDGSIDDIDLTIRPDVPVCQFVQLSNIPNFSSSIASNPTIEMQIFRPTTGQRFPVPLVMLAAELGYRVQIPHLQGRKTTIDILMATARMPKQEENGSPLQADYWIRLGFTDPATGIQHHAWYGHPNAPDIVFGVQSEATSVNVSGHYIVGGVTVPVSENIKVWNPMEKIIQNARPQ